MRIQFCRRPQQEVAEQLGEHIAHEGVRWPAVTSGRRQDGAAVQHEQVAGVPAHNPSQGHRLVSLGNRRDVLHLDVNPVGFRGVNGKVGDRGGHQLVEPLTSAQGRGDCCRDERAADAAAAPIA